MTCFVEAQHWKNLNIIAKTGRTPLYEYTKVEDFGAYLVRVLEVCKKVYRKQQDCTPYQAYEHMLNCAALKFQEIQPPPYEYKTKHILACENIDVITEWPFDAYFIQYISLRGFDITYKNNVKILLFWAIYHDDAKIFEILAHAAPAVVSKHALKFGVLFGRRELVFRLVENKIFNLKCLTIALNNCVAWQPELLHILCRDASIKLSLMSQSLLVHHAIQAGNIQSLEILSGFGFNLPAGETVYPGNLEIYDYLMQTAKYSDLNVSTKNILLWACCRNNLPEVQKILMRGLVIMDYERILPACVLYRSHHVLGWILRNHRDKFDINGDFCEKGLLFWCILNDRSHVMTDLLLEAGANINASTTEKSTLLQALSVDGVLNPDIVPDILQNYPVSSLKHRNRHIKYLISKGADVFGPDNVILWRLAGVSEVFVWYMQTLPDMIVRSEVLNRRSIHNIALWTNLLISPDYTEQDLKSFGFEMNHYPQHELESIFQIWQQQMLDANKNVQKMYLLLKRRVSYLETLGYKIDIQIAESVVQEMLMHDFTRALSTNLNAFTQFLNIRRITIA